MYIQKRKFIYHKVGPESDNERAAINFLLSMPLHILNCRWRYCRWRCINVSYPHCRRSMHTKKRQSRGNDPGFDKVVLCFKGNNTILTQILKCFSVFYTGISQVMPIEGTYPFIGSSNLCTSCNQQHSSVLRQHNCYI